MSIKFLRPRRSGVPRHVIDPENPDEGRISISLVEFDDDTIDLALAFTNIQPTLRSTKSGWSILNWISVNRFRRKDGVIRYDPIPIASTIVDGVGPVQLLLKMEVISFVGGPEDAPVDPSLFD